MNGEAIYMMAIHNKSDFKKFYTFISRKSAYTTVKSEYKNSHSYFHLVSNYFEFQILFLLSPTLGYSKTRAVEV